MPDFFLDEFLTQMPAAAAAAPATPAQSETTSGKGKVDQVFDSIMAMSSAEIVQKTNAVFAFEVQGAEEGKWFLDLKNGTGSSGKGEPPVAADATLIMNSDDFVKMFQGNAKLHFKPFLAF